MKVGTPLRLVLRVCSVGRCPVCDAALYRSSALTLAGSPYVTLLCRKGCSTIRVAGRRLPEGRGT